MTFAQFCVGVVTTIFVGIAAFIISLIFFGIFHCDKDDQIYFGAWIVSSIGFGVCFTMLLYQNGMIK